MREVGDVNISTAVPSPMVLQQRKKTFFQKLYRANWRKAVIAGTFFVQ
jgi:hypothetical protein